MSSSSSSLSLGEYSPKRYSFASLDPILAYYDTAAFQQLSVLERFQKINSDLLTAIREAPQEQFLLPAIVEWIDRVNQKAVLDGFSKSSKEFHFQLFEFWLNLFSGLSDADQLAVRGKIVGQWVPRDEYQPLFPIGMEKSYPGSHFVVAHLSPDSDATVASFWGWIDAFAARVGTGLHRWALPGGAPDTPTAAAMQELLGRELFSLLADRSESLKLTAMDLVTQKGLMKCRNDHSFGSSGINKNDCAVIFVDEQGYYVGEGPHRNNDQEPIDLNTSIEEIRIKMGKCDYLTVVIKEREDKLFPVGVIWNQSIHKETLGTVTFRDFCNLEEVRMPSYLMPISVMDHHKVSLKTTTPPVAMIADVQSCNVLVLERSFGIHDRYSLPISSVKQQRAEIERLSALIPASDALRLLRKLLQRFIAYETRGPHYVTLDRQWIEYVTCLHAILDDTDLLTKISRRDVECVADLVNRMKSIAVGQDLLPISLDGLDPQKEMAKQAANRILQNSEMHSFYKKIYEIKEREVEALFTPPLEQHLAHLFADAKEQNGCCRVGQTKFFAVNYPSYCKAASELRTLWEKKAQEIYKAHNAIDLHLQMMSTVASSTEVYQGTVGQYKHQDELWVWVPPTKQGYDHLSSFFTAFGPATRVGSQAAFQFHRNTPQELQLAMRQQFPEVTILPPTDQPLTGFIFYFPAGLLNSRKAMVTPFLPKIARQS